MPSQRSPQSRGRRQALLARVALLACCLLAAAAACLLPAPLSCLLLAACCLLLACCSRGAVAAVAAAVAAATAAAAVAAICCSPFLASLLPLLLARARCWDAVDAVSGAVVFVGAPESVDFFFPACFLIGHRP